MVGDLVIGATSTDVISNLQRDHVTRAAPALPGGGPRMETIPRLAQHVLEQRCYFPMFPAPPAVAGAKTPSDPTGFTCAEAAAPLELSQLYQLGMTCAPDVLLLPSKLKTFARPLGCTLAVNPGNLCRMNAGGTFAKITVARPTAATAAKREWEAAECIYLRPQTCTCILPAASCPHRHTLLSFILPP